MLRKLWWILILIGVVAVVLLLIWVGDDSRDPTDRDIVLTIASGLLSGVVLGGVLWATQLAREIDSVRRDQRLELARQLRGVHARVKAAQARIEGAGSVRTYGIEARAELIPALHELRGVKEDLAVWKPAKDDLITAITSALATAETHLQGLVDEYRNGYIDFSTMSKTSVEKAWNALLESAKMTRTVALIDDELGNQTGLHYNDFVVPMKCVRRLLLS